MRQASNLVIYIGLLTISLHTIGFAEEVDDFTPPSNQPKDSAAVIDLATNTLIDELVELLNKAHLPHCDDPQKYQMALKKLDQNFTAIGNGLRAGPELYQLLNLIANDPQHRSQHERRLREVQDTWLAEFPRDKRDWFTKLFSSLEYFGPRENKGSIYQDLDFLTCCTSRLNVNGVYLGLDKIDHFFGNGGLLFEQLITMKPSDLPLEEKLRRVMAINVRQEHTLWGLKGLSPKSYGDLAANWQGLHFYQQLFNGDNSYIQCDNKYFKRNLGRPFRIDAFVDEAWNESTNCSSFVSEHDLELFRRNLKRAGTQCPRNPSICESLVKKHKDDPLFLEYSLSPLCSGLNRHFIPIEEAIPISWDEVELSFRGFTWPIIKDLAIKKWTEFIQGLIPSYFKSVAANEGRTIFNQLRACRSSPPSEKLACLKNYTEPEISVDQLNKFSSLITDSADFSSLDSCSKQSEQLEKMIHPQPIGDMSLCFTTHYRNRETQGRIYFRHHHNGLKVVLLRY